MNALAEKLILQDSIAKLEHELASKINTMSTCEFFDYYGRLNTLKQCYTRVLELLDQERRTKPRPIDAAREYCARYNDKAISRPKSSSAFSWITKGVI